MAENSSPFPSLLPSKPGLVVGVAEMKVSSNPDDIIVTYALGSCLGITLHDPRKCVGGLLHIMLPTAQLHGRSTARPAMFLDTGLPLLMQAVLDAGADRESLRCKVFGGAQLLATDNFFRIGAQNVETCYKLTSEMGLRVHVWEVSGSVNRTIRLVLRTGDVHVRVPARPEFIR